MKISTQFSVSFREQNISPKEFINNLVHNGYLDARENSEVGRWFSSEVLPWMKLVRDDNQNVTGNDSMLPPIWEKVYPDVYISVDGETFIVHCKLGTEDGADYHRTSFTYPVARTHKDKKGDEWEEKYSVMNFRLVPKVYTDEPIFVIKGRDPQAPRTVADWAIQRMAGQHYDTNPWTGQDAQDKAKGALAVVDQMKLWKADNGHIGAKDCYGRPTEYTLAHRISFLLADAAAVNVRVTIENKVDPLTGRGESVVDYRRMRNYYGEYSNTHMKGYYIAVQQNIVRGSRELDGRSQTLVLHKLDKEELLKYTAVPSSLLIPPLMVEAEG